MNATTPPIGPSDSSDSPSDLGGLEDRGDPSAPLDGNEARSGVPPESLDPDDASDSGGTGERRSAGNDAGGDFSPDTGLDRVVDADEAGLGDGLDEAEEAEVDPVHAEPGDATKRPPDA